MREFALAVATYLVSASISVAAGIAGGVWYARHQDRPPALVVLDMRRLVEPLAADIKLDDAERRKRIERLGESATHTINSYAARGAIVLDGSAVLRAPSTVYVNP